VRGDVETVPTREAVKKQAPRDRRWRGDRL